MWCVGRLASLESVRRAEEAHEEDVSERQSGTV